MKTKLIFVRHAEAEGNLKRIFHGWTDGDITEKGHVQAKLVAERLKDFQIDLLYSSSMKRTISTAKYISDIKNIPIIRTDKLKEINGGDWEGKNWDQLPHLWPEEYGTWENSPHKHRMPNGETMEDFQKRLIGEIDYIIGNNKGRNICIVTHGTAIRSLMCYFLHCDLDEMIKIKWYDNTSITIIEHEKDRFNILLEGDASHLGKEYSTIENQEWWDEYIKKYDNINGKREA
ncbi:UNVERIFIED_CONTAM: putative phosphoglycerate mutase [Acetivibrio alkalicellulosi]